MGNQPKQPYRDQSCGLCSRCGSGAQPGRSRLRLRTCSIADADKVFKAVNEGSLEDIKPFTSETAAAHNWKPTDAPPEAYAQVRQQREDAIQARLEKVRQKFGVASIAYQPVPAGGSPAMQATCQDAGASKEQAALTLAECADEARQAKWDHIELCRSHEAGETAQQRQLAQAQQESDSYRAQLNDMLRQLAACEQQRQDAVVSAAAAQAELRQMIAAKEWSAQQAEQRSAALQAQVAQQHASALQQQSRAKLAEKQHKAAIENLQRQLSMATATVKKLQAIVHGDSKTLSKIQTLVDREADRHAAALQKHLRDHAHLAPRRASILAGIPAAAGSAEPSGVNDKPLANADPKGSSTVEVTKLESTCQHQSKLPCTNLGCQLMHWDGGHHTRAYMVLGCALCHINTIHCNDRARPATLQRAQRAQNENVQSENAQSASIAATELRCPPPVGQYIKKTGFFICSACHSAYQAAVARAAISA